MDTSRAIQIRDRLVSRIIDAYSTAHICNMTHAELLDSLQSLFAELPKKTPRYVTEYARGYAHALDRELFKAAMVYGGLVDGVFYSTWRNRSDYYGKHGIEHREFADDERVKNRGFYWGDDTSKPFFISPAAATVNPENKESQ